MYFNFSGAVIVFSASEGTAVQAAIDLPVCESEPAFGYIDAFVDEVYVKYGE